MEVIGTLQTDRIHGGGTEQHQNGEAKLPKNTMGLTRTASQHEVYMTWRHSPRLCGDNMQS